MPSSRSLGVRVLSGLLATAFLAASVPGHLHALDGSGHLHAGTAVESGHEGSGPHASAGGEQGALFHPHDHVTSSSDGLSEECELNLPAPHLGSGAPPPCGSPSDGDQSVPLDPGNCPSCVCPSGPAGCATGAPAPAGVAGTPTGASHPSLDRPGGSCPSCPSSGLFRPPRV